MLEIQQAHTAQQVYVQKLQDKLSDISRYRSTIKIQEQIIRKFESLLKDSSQAQEIKTPIPSTIERSPTETANQDALIARENRILLSRIQDLEFSLEKAAKSTNIVREHDDTLETFKLELEAERNA